LFNIKNYFIQIFFGQVFHCRGCFPTPGNIILSEEIISSILSVIIGSIPNLFSEVATENIIS
jgi:hypothetical protein